MLTIQDVKAQAKRLMKLLPTPVPYQEALEKIAQIHGYKNWQTFSAQLQNQETAAPVGMVPPDLAEPEQATIPGEGRLFRIPLTVDMTMSADIFVRAPDRFEAVVVARDFAVDNLQLFTLDDGNYRASGDYYCGDDDAIEELTFDAPRFEPGPTLDTGVLCAKNDDTWQELVARIEQQGAGRSLTVELRSLNGGQPLFAVTLPLAEHQLPEASALLALQEAGLLVQYLGQATPDFLAPFQALVFDDDPDSDTVTVNNDGEFSGTLEAEDEDGRFLLVAHLSSNEPDCSDDARRAHCSCDVEIRSKDDYQLVASLSYDLECHDDYKGDALLERLQNRDLLS